MMMKMKNGLFLCRCVGLGGAAVGCGRAFLCGTGARGEVLCDEWGGGIGRRKKNLVDWVNRAVEVR